MEFSMSIVKFRGSEAVQLGACFKRPQWTRPQHFRASPLAIQEEASNVGQKYLYWQILCELFSPANR